MKRWVISLVIFIPLMLLSQTFPRQKYFQWPDTFVNYPKVPDSLTKEQAIVLKEQVFFTNTFIKKRIAVKIQSEDGVKRFSSIELPENFDLTNYPNINKQGRFKGRKDPFLKEYKIEYFSARIIKPDMKVVDLPMKNSFRKVCWVKHDGERIYDNISTLQIEGLEIGDILEYTYKAFVNWDATITSVFPNGEFPKMDYYLVVTSSVPAALSKIRVIHLYGIDENAIKTTTASSLGDLTTTKTIHLENINSVKYPQNSRPGSNMPYVSANYGMFTITNASKSSNSASKKYYFFDPNTWLVNIDTLEKSEYYDKYNANIRKYTSNFTVSPSDTFKMAFASKLVDSLNALKFLSSEEVRYSGNAQYSMPSAELLNKGKITEEFVSKNYGDLIKSKEMFYYDGIVIDKRLGEVTLRQRSLSYLEKKLYVFPVKNSFKYLHPRIKGLKYFLDELPFYLEGINCVLIPRNIAVMNDKIQAANVLLTKTPKSVFNENVRTESVQCLVSTDSMKISLFFKESLSGQFSTILRHYYDEALIDSTISPVYFKKCTDKPFSASVKITKSSANKTFPFKHSYNCSSNVKLFSKGQLNISEWFSFVFSGEQFNEKPNHDFYLDFQFTDSYNFLFEFDKHVEITNNSDFNKKLSNEYFEVISNLVKQESNKYLLSVIIKVKQEMVPGKDVSKIMDFVSLLDGLNHQSINYKVL